MQRGGRLNPSAMFTLIAHQIVMGSYDDNTIAIYSTAIHTQQTTAKEGQEEEEKSNGYCAYCAGE